VKTEPVSLLADSVTIGRSVNLTAIKSEGLVKLVNAHVHNDLVGERVRFVGSIRNGLDAERACISGVFFWREIFLSPQTEVSVLHARVGVLADDAKSWPETTTSLDGFVYEAISRESFKGTERIAWLAKQGTEYRPQPYKQLAKALSDAGQLADAKVIEIEREQARRTSLASTHGWLAAQMLRLWSFILKRTIGYGYKPWNLAVPAIVTLSLGCLFFSTGYEAGLIVPTQERAAEYFKQHECNPPNGYQQFNSFVYSLESLLPGLNLKHREYWIPDPSVGCRRDVRNVLGYNLPNALARGYTSLLEQTLRGYLWIHAMIGWILAVLLGAALTGVVHKE
jgi:hypothetical protein